MLIGPPLVVSNMHIPIGEVLRNHQIPFNDRCAPCGEAFESIDHLFLLCPWSQVCWFSLKWNIRSDKIMDQGGFSDFFLTATLMSAANNQMLEFLQDIFLTTFYIWENRNMVRHGKGLLSLSKFCNYVESRNKMGV